VEVSVADTCASATTAPEGSVTVPDIVAVVSCAANVDGKAVTAINVKTNNL
jgi:hypothetical protein